MIDGRDRAVTGLNSSGDVQRTVGKNYGGFGEDVSAKTGVPYFASAGTFSFGTLPGTAGGTGRTDGKVASIVNQGSLATRSDVLAGTHIKDSGGTILGNNDIKNSSLDVDIVGTAIKLKIGTTETSTVTATQALVGLSGVQNNADRTADNTAANIAGQGSLATRSDVRAGTHIKDSGGTVLGDTAIKNSSVTLAKSAGNGTTGATFSLTNGNAATVALTAADAQVASDSSGINIAGTRKATHNGTTINTSGNVTGSMSVASGGSITIGNVTIDGTNGRILITD